MARRPNDVVAGFLQLAGELAEKGTFDVLGAACRRRAVSTAYYAVFHALCDVCAEALVGPGRRELREAIYRTLEHGAVRKVLASEEARAKSPLLRKLGPDFATLQRERHLADYRPPLAGLVSRDKAFVLVALAEQTVRVIEDLDAEASLALAVLLISRPRS